MKPGRIPSSASILILLCAAQFMLILDIAVVNVALPSIKRELEISPADLQWVATAYTITFGGLLILFGRAGDLYGRRRLFVWGLVLFTLASALCGVAQDDLQLFVARALQGVAAAAVSASALALLVTNFPDGADRARAMGIFGAVASSGAVAGGLFGGVLTDFLDWRAIFLVNVPIGIVAVVLAPRVIAEAPTRERSRIDVAGAASLTAALILLTLGLTGTGTGGIDSRALALCGAAVLLLALFGFVESRHQEPLVRLGLFRIRAVSSGNAAMALSAGAIGGMMFFVTLYLQLVLGHTPLAVAFAFAPVTIVIALLSTRAGLLAERYGIRRLVVAGTAITAAGALALATVPEHGSYFANVLPGLMLTAVGMGLFFTPAMLSATAVPGSEQGVASGVIGTSQQLGGALGLAIASTVAAAVTDARGADSGAALVAGYRAGFLVVFGLLALATVAAAFAPGPKRDAQPSMVAARLLYGSEKDGGT